jgi:hypothetical protein
VKGKFIRTSKASPSTGFAAHWARPNPSHFRNQRALIIRAATPGLHGSCGGPMGGSASRRSRMARHFQGWRKVHNRATIPPVRAVKRNALRD